MIYLFLANGFEEIEALSVVDILRRCELQVKTVGVGGRQITGAHGITVTADTEEKLVSPEQADAVILPGGMPGTLNLEQSDMVQTFVDFCEKEKKLICAICAAPSILGHKDLLNGKRATCFPGFEKELNGAQVTGNPVETDGHIITAKGAGAAHLFAFAIAKVFVGEEKANAVKDAMQWGK